MSRCSLRRVLLTIPHRLILPVADRRPLVGQFDLLVTFLGGFQYLCSFVIADDALDFVLRAEDHRHALMQAGGFDVHDAFISGR